MRRGFHRSGTGTAAIDCTEAGGFIYALSMTESTPKAMEAILVAGKN